MISMPTEQGPIQDTWFTLYSEDMRHFWYQWAVTHRFHPVLFLVKEFQI